MKHIQPIHMILLSLTLLMGFSSTAMAQTKDRAETKNSRMESRKSRNIQNRDVRNIKVFEMKVKDFNTAQKAKNTSSMSKTHLAIVGLMNKEMNQTKTKILQARTEIRNSSREVRKGKRDKAFEKRNDASRKELKGKNKNIRDDKRDLKDDERDLAVLQKRYKRQRDIWAKTRKLNPNTNAKAVKIAYNQFLNTLKRDNMFNRKEVREDRRETREDRREMRRNMKN